mgnify:CR=1 FL=1
MAAQNLRDSGLAYFQLVADFLESATLEETLEENFAGLPVQGAGDQLDHLAQVNPFERAFILLVLQEIQASFSVAVTRTWLAHRQDGRVHAGSESPSVFLLSLRAAGTGLNLTSASYVVIYDPWWNPAVEAQAIDRTHRIGQTATVNAYKMISPGTVEEKIWDLQQRKAKTVSDVLGDDGFAKGLTTNDLEYLFSE